ncbi:hypothetical protein F4808DRAFT_472493 [Astrocystis sublimbata]|nr:hypothetical protein F4808DRAFT_472493 [Astrocystis sublimbata]
MATAGNDEQTGRDRRSQWSVDSLFDNGHTDISRQNNQNHDVCFEVNENLTEDVTAAGPNHYQEVLHDDVVHDPQDRSEHSYSPKEELDSASDRVSDDRDGRQGFLRRVRRTWNHGWVAETVCCILAILALLAIVALLRSNQGRPRPQWPLGITINALMAIFSVLMKAGLSVPLSEGISQLKWQWFEDKPRRLIDIDDFDTASRGVWGSFLFLFTAHSKAPATSHGYLAKFAALVIVLTVAVDPFLQQIIAYVDCQQISPDVQSTIARTNNYNRTAGHLSAADSLIDAAMAVAMNTGMVNPPPHIPSLISTECQSGNCTFPNFMTVGACHSCENLSSQVRNITMDTGYGQNWTLPGSPSMDYYSRGIPSLYLNQGKIFTTGVAIPSGSGLLDFRMMSTPKDLDQPFRISAFHCTVTPCVRTYSASVVGGTLHEEQLSSATMGWNQNIQDDQNTDSKASFVRLVTSRTLRNGQYEICEPKENEGPGLIKVSKSNVDAAPDGSVTADPRDTAWYPEDCVWSFGKGARTSIMDELSYQLDDLEMRLGQTVAAGTLVSRNLWMNGTSDIALIDGFFQKLTDVMTTSIRNRGARGSEEYEKGQVIMNSTCVSINWAWLSYPAALVGLATLFLVAILVRDARAPSSARPWKSSPLALLFLSLDESRYDANYYGMTKNDINNFAGAISVQLKRDGEDRVHFS